jgi:hypothetical protein
MNTFAPNPQKTNQSAAISAAPIKKPVNDQRLPTLPGHVFSFAGRSGTLKWPFAQVNATK